MPSFGTLKADTLTHSTAGSLATNFVVLLRLVRQS